MTEIVLVVAVHKEIPASFYEAKGPIARVLVSNVGPQKASLAMRQVIDSRKPDMFVCLGLCGGVQDDLAIGEVIIADKVCWQGQELELEIDPVLIKLLDGQINYRQGKFETFADMVSDRNLVSPKTVAVDQESYFYVKEAQSANIPIMVIKSVSDIVPTTPTSAAEQIAQLNRNFPIPAKSLSLLWQILDGMC